MYRNRVTLSADHLRASCSNLPKAKGSIHSVAVRRGCQYIFSNLNPTTPLIVSLKRVTLSATRLRVCRRGHLPRAKGSIHSVGVCRGCQYIFSNLIPTTWPIVSLKRVTVNRSSEGLLFTLTLNERQYHSVGVCNVCQYIFSNLILKTQPPGL